MYSRILCGYDGSARSHDALQHAVALARAFDAELRRISVEGHLPAYAATSGEVDAAKAKKDRFFSAIKQETVAMARMQGVEPHPVKMVGSPADRIVHYAEEGEFGLILRGEKGHSRAHRFPLGDVSDKDVDHAPCSTLTARSTRRS